MLVPMHPNARHYTLIHIHQYTFAPKMLDTYSHTHRTRSQISSSPMSMDQVATLISDERENDT
jgi:hypothetical protein